MKRKAEDTDPATNANGHSKKQATSSNSVAKYFGPNIFAPETIEQFRDDYETSEPYRHAVVPNLIDDNLLRSVRSEILENIHFTAKETDIYKIHQSGDLANLDGLPESALKRLPSLLKLRDALYSYDFRQWLSMVTGAGPVSGKKTDMAVNVYVPGCHLLCHDDVIGSRRVSYILYLNDPDVPWKPEWGGALRLYPTETRKDDAGKKCRFPLPEWSKSIPPAWNQLSFFAVRPGESFHDVEEVYHPSEDEAEAKNGRFRIAISGWFHIPQEFEEGYVPSLEEEMAGRSSLEQLQGQADQFEEPQIKWHDPVSRHSPTNGGPSSDESSSDEPTELNESDLEHLLQYITPNYLTPDTVEELNEMLLEDSMAQLSDFLNPKFADMLKNWIVEKESGLQSDPVGFTSRPPHKHRYQHLQTLPTIVTTEYMKSYNPFSAVLNDLLPSTAFHKWLSLVTGLTLKRCAIISRRFRRGLDYELAQTYDGDDPQLEYCLCVTPSTGWIKDEAVNGNSDKAKGSHDSENPEADNFGGYELYMAGDDDDEGSEDGVEIPVKLQSQTGAGDRRSATRKKADPAIYKAATDDEDDGIILSNPPTWNTLSVVLRDKGTMRFVKYVSQGAPGDRWDISGAVEVEPDDDVSEEEDE